MTLNKITIFAILLFNIISYSQKKNRTIHSILICKMVVKNGKSIKFRKLDIDSEGVIIQNDKIKEQLNINTFTESMNKLVENGKNIRKIDGTDDKILNQGPHNSQLVFINVIYQDDFDKEKFECKTRYKYQEKDLPIEQSDYLFFKYLNNSDLAIIKKLLD